MKRDIRELFKNDDFPTKKLPKNHREDFFNKLEKISIKKAPKNRFWLKTAASVALIFALSVLVFNKKETQKKPNLLVEVKQIEQEYLKNIDIEWNRFLELTNDQKLIKNYEKRLKTLGENYQQLSTQFQANPNNISLLEELISNLQRRLQILKEIQDHIKKLNQNPKSYETIVI